MRKTFYITDDAWQILQQQENMSRFICDLIIRSQDQTNSLQIIKELLEYVKLTRANNSNSNTNSTKNKSTDNE